MLNRRQLIASSPAVIAGMGRAGAAHPPGPQSWTFDNLQTIAGQPLTLIGAPRTTASPWGKALLFDGVGDGLLIDRHPLAGASAFTIEALFRPDGGAFEQRWFHLEAREQPPVTAGAGKSRLMFEIRVVGSSWYLDSFVSGPDAHQALIVPERTFPIGAWYHVAQSYDGQVHRSFVNGVLQAMAPLSFSPQGPGSAAVGMRLNQVNFFKGAVRAARFTTRALSPSEFSYAFSRRPPGPSLGGGGGRSMWQSSTSSSKRQMMLIP
jgi:hypothetical protein